MCYVDILLEKKFLKKINDRIGITASKEVMNLEYKPSFVDSLRPDIKPSYLVHTMTEAEFDAKKFGLPKYKKYPMPDAAHVRSAIKFFNYVKPSQEKELARNILARMDEYGINPSDINVGDNNRFKKYLPKPYLMHHGIKGMHWGVRRFQNPDGSLTPEGEKRYNKTKELMSKADSYEKAAKYMSSRITNNKSNFQKARIMSQVSKAQRTADNIRKGLDQDMVARVNADKQKTLSKKRYEEEKAYHNSQSSRRDRFMDDAMHEVFGKDTKINYMNIYNEMTKDKRFKNLLESEDNDDYKEAEKAWLQKHEYWDAFLDAVNNGYKDMK